MGADDAIHRDVGTLQVPAMKIVEGVCLHSNAQCHRPMDVMQRPPRTHLIEERIVEVHVLVVGQVLAAVAPRGPTRIP